MLGTTHRPARIPAGAKVELLRKPDSKANRLTPDSLVTVINRGREMLVCKWDGEDYHLQPYTHDGGTADQPHLIQMPYGAALLFQQHCPVPGTRDPYSPTFAAVSFLGILDTESADMCVPFTDEECRKFGQTVEAIERSDEEQRGLQVVDVKKTQHTRVGQGGLGNAPKRPAFQASTPAGEELDAREVMRPATGEDGLNEAQREMQRDAGEHAADEARAKGRARARGRGAAAVAEADE